MKKSAVFEKFGAVFCLLAILLMLAFPVFATEASEDTGWLEVKCKAPSGFTGDVYVMLANNETGDDYTLVCRHVNKHIAREELPVGSYSVRFSFIDKKDGNFQTTCDTYDIEIKKDASVASLINVTVSAVETQPETSVNTEPSTAPESVPENIKPPKGSEPSSESVTEASSNPEQDAPSEPEVQQQVQTRDPEKKDNDFTFGQKLLRWFIGTFIFVGVVFLFAYLYRQFLKNT